MQKYNLNPETADRVIAAKEATSAAEKAYSEAAHQMNLARIEHNRVTAEVANVQGLVGVYSGTLSKYKGQRFFLQGVKASWRVYALAKPFKKDGSVSLVVRELPLADFEILGKYPEVGARG